MAASEIFLATTVNVVETPTTLLDNISANAKQDVTITIPYDLNAIFNGMMLPNVPQTDGDEKTPDNVTQTILQGNSTDDWYQHLVYNIKSNWAERYSTTTSATPLEEFQGYTESQAFSWHLWDALNYLFFSEPYTSPLKTKLSLIKVSDWMKPSSASPGPGPDSFGDVVLDTTQFSQILQNLVASKKYIEQDKFLMLNTGDQIGCQVVLKYSESNTMKMTVLLQQQEDPHLQQQ